MWHRTSKGRGRAASLPILPTASMALAALTGARRAGPALATTPRSRKVVAAGTPPPHAASHRLSAA
eukprot:6637994-Lingulodinium_polyedra.AAC.1